MDLIAEIKSKVDILSLCSKLGFTPDRALFIKSIFREEKTPSLKLYPKSNTFHCFSTGESGDVIDFYQNVCGVDKKKAIKELCSLYGITAEHVDLSRPTVKPQAAPKDDSGDVISAMSEEEREVFYERLGIANSADVAMKAVKFMRLKSNVEVFTELYNYCMQKGYNEFSHSYLCKERMLPEQFLDRFKIFTIGNYFEVNNHMRKSFPLEQLQRSGLYNRKEDGSGNLIFYQHRIIIPYLHKGEIIYVRGRYFDQEGSFKTDRYKYLALRDDGLKLNSPKRFFNTDILKNMLPGERLYISEGEFDAVALMSIGFNCIGIPGTGNIPPIDKFKRLLNFDICLCVDNDTAGAKMLTGNYTDKNGNDKYSENNLINFFAQLNKEVKIKKLPQKDINDFIKSAAK